MKNSIPFLLTTLRLLLGPLALVLALTGWPRLLFLPLLLVATLSDIYDGVLARRFGISTPFLRRYDSLTDILYYLFILACAWKLCGSEIYPWRAAIFALLISEAGCIAVSLARFWKFPATHSHLAKFYGLCLFACLAGLLAFNAPGWTVLVLAAVGLTANLEIILILCLSKQPPVDVSSIFSLRKKRPLKSRE